MPAARADKGKRKTRNDLDPIQKLRVLIATSHDETQSFKEDRDMFYQTEAKPQCWRAVAVFDDRPDQLIYLNRSSTQVRAGYREAYFELLDEEEREHVTSVALQRWQGAPDAGRWMHQSNLATPVLEKLMQAA